jgi:flagellar biogenesis protein FliO
MKVIIAIVVIILLTIAIVWLIDKFVPKKLKPFITLALWGLIIFLGYITFMSVYKEIKFNQLKVERYKVVIDRLVDIRDSQVAYKEVHGEYAGDFNKLINFVENGRVPITQRRDTLVLDVEKTRLFNGVETMKTITLIDTLSYYTVKDSIFNGDSRYKNMMNIGIGKEGAKFTLKADKLDDIPVFEASVDKSIVLDGQDKYLIEKERQAFSVAGVKGESVKIGSLEEVSTSGNWGKDLSIKE